MIRLGFDIELADVMACQHHFAESDKDIRKSVRLSHYRCAAVLLAVGAIIADWNADFFTPRLTAPIAFRNGK